MSIGLGESLALLLALVSRGNVWQANVPMFEAPNLSRGIVHNKLCIGHLFLYISIAHKLLYKPFNPFQQVIVLLMCIITKQNQRFININVTDDVRFVTRVVATMAHYFSKL